MILQSALLCLCCTSSGTSLCRRWRSIFTRTYGKTPTSWKPQTPARHSNTYISLRLREQSLPRTHRLPTPAMNHWWKPSSNTSGMAAGSFSAYDSPRTCCISTSPLSSVALASCGNVDGCIVRPLRSIPTVCPRHSRRRRSPLHTRCEHKRSRMSLGRVRYTSRHLGQTTSICWTPPRRIPATSRSVPRPLLPSYADTLVMLAMRAVDERRRNSFWKCVGSSSRSIDKALDEPHRCLRSIHVTILQNPHSTIVSGTRSRRIMYKHVGMEDLSDSGDA